MNNLLDPMFRHGRLLQLVLLPLAIGCICETPYYRDSIMARLVLPYKLVLLEFLSMPICIDGLRRHAQFNRLLVAMPKATGERIWNCNEIPRSLKWT